MKFIKNHLAITFALSVMVACGSKANEGKVYLQDTFATQQNNPTQIETINKDTITASNQPDYKTEDIIAYAKTLVGVPYKYGSTDQEIGFDCSGFITAVYRHFNISVPRSSVDFTNYGTTIPIEECKSGDLILFTGTDPTKRIVGHMGIIVQTQDTIKFIHSTSGKAYGVTITPLNSGYQRRFEKIVRMEGYLN